MSGPARLVRVPRAFGAGGEDMERAAHLYLGLVEAAVVAEETLDEETAVLTHILPERPVLMGGCCCTHVGAVRGLAMRHGRISVVWLDAHGDLNTPETSPSGNVWGMPYRMLLDDGIVQPGDAALIGARSLDPPEEEFIASVGLETTELGLADVIDETAGIYIAFDCDVLDPGEFHPFMPEPDGITVAHAEELVSRVAAMGPVVGMGFTGVAADPANEPALRRFLAAAGMA
jgi:arginase